MNFIDVNPEANRSELFAASWQGRVTVVTPPGPALVSSPCLVLPNGMAQLRPRLGRLHGKQACGKGEQGHRCCRASWETLNTVASARTELEAAVSSPAAQNMQDTNT